MSREDDVGQMTGHYCRRLEWLRPATKISKSDEFPSSTVLDLLLPFVPRVFLFFGNNTGGRIDLAPTVFVGSRYEFSVGVGERENTWENRTCEFRSLVGSNVRFIPSGATDIGIRGRRAYSELRNSAAWDNANYFSRLLNHMPFFRMCDKSS